MCVVSMIGDHYRDHFNQQYPWTSPSVPPAQWPLTGLPGSGGLGAQLPVPRAEFEALKRDVEQMRELLKRAKLYDERNSEPECEVDEKMDLLRRVAKLVGIDINDVIPAKP